MTSGRTNSSHSYLTWATRHT